MRCFHFVHSSLILPSYTLVFFLPLFNDALNIEYIHNRPSFFIYCWTYAAKILIDLKGSEVVYNTQNHGVCGLWLSSGILND
jgi:hypothetical protein